MTMPSSVEVGATLCTSSDSWWEHPANEYASAAAVEGFAQYYASMVFNRVDEADCALEFFFLDFDGDGDEDARALTGGFTTVYNCMGEPYWCLGQYDTWTPTSADHLGTRCDGVKPNRGTAFDWQRFFWDLDAQKGLTLGQILTIWDGVNSKSWRETDTGTNKKPWERIRDEADSMGIGTDVRGADSVNGVGRL